MQAHQRSGERSGLAHLAGDLPVIGPCCIEQQQSMTRGCGIEHHKSAPRFVHHMRKLTEHRHFLGARRPQVFGQHGTPGFVEILAFGGHHPLAIRGRRCHWINSGHLQTRHVTGQSLGEVRGRIGGGEKHVVTSMGQRHCDRGRHGGLSHPALTHAHHQAIAVALDLVDQPNQRQVDSHRVDSLSGRRRNAVRE